MKTRKKLVLVGLTALLLSVSACSVSNPDAQSPVGDPASTDQTSSSSTGRTRDNCPIKVPGRVFNDGGPAKYDWQGENGRLHVPDRDAYAQPELVGTPGNEYWSGCNRDPVKGARWSGGPYDGTQEMADEFMRVFGSNCIPNSRNSGRDKYEDYACDGYDWSAVIEVVPPGVSPESKVEKSEYTSVITGSNWYILSAKGPSENYIQKQLSKATR